MVSCSDTYKRPLPSKTTPYGEPNEAAVPTPSALVHAPAAPASTVTAPLGTATETIRQEVLSATKRKLEPSSNEIIVGPPIPAARVVTAADATAMARMRLFMCSATKTVAPVLSVATSVGHKKVAAEPIPFALPLATPPGPPPPASVVTTFVTRSNARTRLLL